MRLIRFIQRRKQQQKTDNKKKKKKKQGEEEKKKKKTEKGTVETRRDQQLKRAWKFSAQLRAPSSCYYSWKLYIMHGPSFPCPVSPITPFFPRRSAGLYGQRFTLRRPQCQPGPATPRLMSPDFVVAAGMMDGFSQHCCNSPGLAREELLQLAPGDIRWLCFHYRVMREQWTSWNLHGGLCRQERRMTFFRVTDSDAFESAFPRPYCGKSQLFCLGAV